MTLVMREASTPSPGNHRLGLIWVLLTRTSRGYDPRPSSVGTALAFLRCPIHGSDGEDKQVGRIEFLRHRLAIFNAEQLAARQSPRDSQQFAQWFGPEGRRSQNRGYVQDECLMQMGSVVEKISNGPQKSSTSMPSKCRMASVVGMAQPSGTAMNASPAFTMIGSAVSTQPSCSTVPVASRPSHSPVMGSTLKTDTN
jgi:hypothetical protein